VHLAIDGKAILDSSNKIVYVQYEDFRKRSYIIYVIDGKRYKQETDLPNAYGLINKHTKANSKLNKKLDSITNELENYTVNVYRGLAAYKKFGYSSVFGVIEVTRK